MTTAPAIEGRKDVAEQAAATLKLGGFSPLSVTALGNYIHVRYMGRDPAERTARLFLAAKFKSAKVYESVNYNKVNAGGTNRPSTYPVWVCSVVA